MKKKRIIPALIGGAMVAAAMAAPTRSVIDQVIWVVGDQPIYLSEVEDL